MLGRLALAQLVLVLVLVLARLALGQPVLGLLALGQLALGRVRVQVRPKVEPALEQLEPALVWQEAGWSGR